ncbi:glycosyltransferase [Schaalia vaccimaxillae]|uniref:glycosyltransferase n=1 Tax=Schaalia vaccimaxillae TaxID=183916 RepID=UPI00040C2C0C|nr:glycosyltransferase [Schaalia vaccimaxillae]
MMPFVTVLMATFNGRQWIDEQVDSILNQKGVDVRLVVSDDGSTDGTREHLQARAQNEARIVVLPQRHGNPGVTENFLHLFTGHTPDGSFVAFSDQDDIWHSDKLSRQLQILEDNAADVVSSNVLRFDETGKRVLIRKSSPQRKWDHIFEAAGPGSTYVFTPDAHKRIVDVLATLDYSQIGVHDWYLYALARGIQAKWIIDKHPTLDYRQHAGNVQGANVGTLARISRLNQLKSGFYRDQFIKVAQAVAKSNTYSAKDREDLDQLIDLLQRDDFAARAALFLKWPQIRRIRWEGVQLAGARLLGVW